MLIKYFYDERLAQASYLVACPESKAAAVIDPSRDITQYLEAASANDVRILYALETHIHADFVSGSRELASATGARIGLSALGGTDWQYDFPDGDDILLLYDEDRIEVGNLSLRVLATPGHTPEHICFELTDSNAGEPVGIFTGDFLFVGDIGRPDLLELAAKVANTRETGARQQFANVQRFRAMPDYLMIWPGHGAGSACGKNLGAVPSTTLGYEKRFNPGFQMKDEISFVDWLLAGQPEVPHYFGHMKHINRVGPDLLLALPQAQHIKGQPGEIVPQDAFLIDTRPRGDFSARHLPGSINIPISSKGFATYVGWYVDYEKPTFFIAYPNDVIQVLNALFSIGVDHVPGYFTTEVLNGSSGTLLQVSPQIAHDAGYHLLDVRGEEEYETRHIPGAQHIPMGNILDQISSLPRNGVIAVYCASGLRAQVVASLLKAQGLTQVVNIEGGLDAWREAGLPVEES